MAAFCKFQRRQLMGDVHSLPEFRRKKERSGTIRVLERAEEDRLFSAVRNRSANAYGFSVFLVDTGCRFEEARQLTWLDIDEHGVSFTTSGCNRTVPLTARVRELLNGRSRSQSPFGNLIQSEFEAIWNNAKDDVNLGADDQIAPEALRHTCAARLVQGGIDIKRVQKWLGHKTLQMTMRYAHLATLDLDGCVAVLEIRENTGRSSI